MLSSEVGNAVTHRHPHVQKYSYFVDGKEFFSSQAKISALEIMQTAGIPPEVGLIEIGDDGVQRSVGRDEVIDLKDGKRFRRPPRFKRG
jgi:hypothetical protein